VEVLPDGGGGDCFRRQAMPAAEVQGGTCRLVGNPRLLLLSLSAVLPRSGRSTPVVFVLPRLACDGRRCSAPT
jgi:hypothetical protein